MFECSWRTHERGSKEGCLQATGMGPTWRKPDSHSRLTQKGVASDPPGALYCTYMPLAGTRARVHGSHLYGHGSGTTLAQARHPFSIIIKGAASDPPEAFHTP